jgi:hypothetical protein
MQGGVHRGERVEGSTVVRTWRVLPNTPIDTDVLSVGVARLLAAGHLQRYVALHHVR